MNVRSPIGALLVLILVGIALFFRPGWQLWADSLVASHVPVVAVDSPGVTELTVIAIAPLRTSPNGWSDYLQYALSGRWPNAPVQATVQVDNRRVGSTPVVGWPLQPGARTLVVSQSGFITETIAFEARSDATHRAEVVLFPLDAREVRSRHLEESAFYARVMPIYLAMLYAVVAFNLLSVVTGLRRRFFARLLIALVHVPAAVLLWLPAIRLAVALDIPHWVAFSLGSGLIGLLPLALHPARARDRVYAR